MWGIIHKKQLTASGLRSCNSRSLSNQKFPWAHPASLNPMTTPSLPEKIELHRDRMWRRDEDLRIENAIDAERFIEDVGFGPHRPIFGLFDTIAAREERGTTMTERGKIHSGSIVLDEPIDLPEGTEVIVHVEPVVHEHPSTGNGNEFENLPFFGMWADRDEMSDSVAWVRKERDKWQQRLTQQR